ncbi:MAG: HAE1 family hydrophobic/amphiphilic exporter-1 [Bradymonadia bacterium]|jgi:HAE1 family hydrophobic/amphiphilic exporter-1
MMVVAAVVVFGWVSLKQMAVDLMPELSYPSVTVRTEYAGAAPEEVEDAITEPIEEYLGTVEGLVGMRSVSRAGSSDVIFRFAWNTDLDIAIQKVRERLSFLEFPDGADQPLILRYDPSLDPIVELAVVGEGMAADELRTYVVEELERALEQVEGVAMVRVTGGEERIISVALNEARLEGYGIDVATVVERLRTENVNVAGGRLYEGEIEYLVRTVNEFTSTDDIAGVVIAVRGMVPVRLSEVATISRATREREVLTRIDGQPSVEIAIFKDADANIVSVANAVRERLYGDLGLEDEDAASEVADGTTEGSGEADGDEDSTVLFGEQTLAEAAPEGVEILTLTDQSTYIQAAIDEVTRTAMLGGLCAVLVLFLFLRSPFATLVIGTAIPLSVIATFAPMRLLGVSINIMSLGGIALGIGMLVDNAIVVLESIVRCREEGDSPVDASIRGTREVAGAVTASTLTTVAVFFPIVFVEGIAGQLFGDLGIAVVLSLLASLVFALLFVPMMAVLPARIDVESTRRAIQWRQLVRIDAWTVLRDDLAWAKSSMARGKWRAAYALPLGLLAVPRFVLAGVLEGAARLVFAIILLIVGVVGGAVWLIGWIAKWVFWLPLKGFDFALSTLTKAYRRLLASVLRARLLVVGIAAILMWWAVTTWPLLGTQLIPELQQGVFMAELRLPVGSGIDETAAALSRVEERLIGNSDIERIAVFIGRDDDDLEASEQGEHTAEVTIVVANAGTDTFAEARAVEAVRAAVSVEPAMQFEISRPTLLSLADPIEVEVRGENLEALRVSAGAVETAVRATDGVTDVRSQAREGFPEVRVRFDRERLASYGLEVRTVAETVRAKVLGETATELRSGERSLDVEVAVDRAQVSDVEALRHLVVAFVDVSPTQLLAGSSAGVDLSTSRRPVRLDTVADVTVERGPAEIRHVDGQRAAVIRASTSVVDLSRTVDALRANLRNVPLREGQLIVVSGQSEEMKAARRSLGFALALAIFLVYVVMASNFESLLGPLVILLTIPLALVGVVAALAYTSTPVSVVVLIGIIVLAGIVVNNAIVLIDYVLTLRRRGMEKREAVIEACSLRLRPVLITALTTVLGLLPMAVGLGEGAEIRRPLAWVVIAGLAAGTLLTLVVIPVVYDLVTPRGAMKEREPLET